MKRYVCTVAIGFVVALAGTGTATAGILPVLDQTGTQATSFGDQTVGEQKNDADVNQYQGNGNINVAPAIAVFGDAKTSNEQGNGNTAVAVVDQSNSVDQSQTSIQKQSLEQDGNACCAPKSYGPPKCEYGGSCERHPYWKKKDGCCEAGPSQTGEQSASFGDQTVGKQRNDADVTQKQGNGNVNIAPAISLGGSKGDSCYSPCEESWNPTGGGAETTNSQGNGNTGVAWVDQSNSVDQSQVAYQFQNVVDQCKGLVTD